ncbi:hypothetical protein Tco_0382502 [Tanacetum coccineum]
MISVNDLKTDSENDNEKVMPLIPSPEPAIGCFNDLDFFKEFENEFPAIVYNDAQTSKADLLTEPILSPQHINEFNLNDETSVSEYDERNKTFCTLMIYSPSTLFLKDPRDFAKPVKAIVLPQDVPSTSDLRLIELENEVQCLMEALLAPIQPTKVNKINTPCKICKGPHDTHVCIDDPEQACVDYASSRINEMGSERFTPNQGPMSFNDATNTWKEKPNFN